MFPAVRLLTRPQARARIAQALGATISVVLLAVGCGATAGNAGHHEQLPAQTAHASGSLRYVALGDSYTAAPGVPDQVGPARCFRSDHNYPSLVAKRLHAGTFIDSSCSGADTGDMTHAEAPGVPPQFDALRPTTDLVTVGIGGNDLGLFGALVRYCVQLASSDPTGSPCTDALRSRPGAVRGVLATIEKNVIAVLRGIRSRAPHATIVAVGYPQIVPGAGRCPSLPLAAGDYRLGRAINEGLDDAVGRAARAAGVRFVDLWGPSSGHDVCAGHPWINGVHLAPGRAIPFHPFEVEQRAVAGLVVSAVRRTPTSTGSLRPAP